MVLWNIRKQGKNVDHCFPKPKLTSSNVSLCLKKTKIISLPSWRVEDTIKYSHPRSWNHNILDLYLIKEIFRKINYHNCLVHDTFFGRFMRKPQLNSRPCKESYSCTPNTFWVISFRGLILKWFLWFFSKCIISLRI